ncbi:MAG: hypothetical protein J6X45_02550 [Lachnospiraceae bacterium]|nr:hypothetical protein [Lachnospiraceae bacterium]
MEYRIVTSSSELEHHGILGQKWGIRRYQNPDGTLTDQGRKRLNRDTKQLERKQDRVEKQQMKYAAKVDKFNRLDNKKLFRNKDRVKKASEKLHTANAKFTRSLHKADKFYKKMEKRYGKELTKNLDSRLIDRGKAYASASINTNIMAMNMSTLRAMGYDDE